MAEFIATYTTGFRALVERKLKEDIEDLRVIQCFDGLIQFRSSVDIRRLRDLLYLNNIFYVMKCFRNNESFEQMVQTIGSGSLAPLLKRGTFRVRFSEANRFVGVPGALVKQTETYIMQRSALTVDRVGPRTEIWYLRRTEGVSFLAQLLFKRRTTEKNLPQGRLRPEFAYLLCCMADLQEGSAVCDPFAGSGSIPEQLLRLPQVNSVWISDLDPAKAEELQTAFQGPRARVFQADARHLEAIKDASIDAIITDPPWGYYEAIDNIDAFYKEVLNECRRILTPRGSITLVTAQKQVLEAAADASGFSVAQRVDTLVNGKKAGVFRLQKKNFSEEK